MIFNLKTVNIGIKCHIYFGMNIACIYYEYKPPGYRGT
jgi:hypothetical protein